MSSGSIGALPTTMPGTKASNAILDSTRARKRPYEKSLALLFCALFAFVFSRSGDRVRDRGVRGESRPAGAGPERVAGRTRAGEECHGTADAGIGTRDHAPTVDADVSGRRCRGRGNGGWC